MPKSVHIIPVAAAIALCLILLRFMNYNLVIMNNAAEWYAGLIGLLFLGIGIWMARKFQKPKVETKIVEKTVFATGPFEPDTDAITHLGLKPRELEVLQLMAEGLSNAEIAERLFISVSTVKTHVSGVFTKLDVNSRTKALDQARKRRIVA
jgi:DNA-binding CsgD family transcriptional regulator